MPDRFARAARRAAGAALLLGVAACSTLPDGSMSTANQTPDITPGMTRQEVLNRLGRPTWVFGVWQENLTILNYRFSHSDCTIYQVSVRPDGTVRDAGSAWDPACDGPSGRD
jgi:hypothetical protein